MVFGLTHPLTEMSNKNISWMVKAAAAYGWQPYHLHVPIVLKYGGLNLQEPSGAVQACTGIVLHHPNNRLENICDIYLPHLNFVAKNLFLCTECDGEAFAPCNPM